MSKVRILLTTYNGEKYLRQQLYSLSKQDYDDYEVIISDDGSTDSTSQIIREYVERYPKLFKCYYSGIRFGNPNDHFMHLLKKYWDCDYLMFCDQDDIWHSDKVSILVNAALILRESGEKLVLVHSGRNIIDGDGNIIIQDEQNRLKKYWTNQKINRLLVNGSFQGCALLFSREVAKIASEYAPSNMRGSYDAWIGLIAYSLGEVQFIPVATMDYRRHGDNASGYKSHNPFAIIIESLQNNLCRKGMILCAQSAKEYSVYLSDVLPDDVVFLASRLASTEKMGYFQRKYIYLRYGLLKYGFARCMGQILFG